ncbi:MAG: OmpH family outer membrane protein [Gallionellaceae bacterium]|jgi:outer membrane protein|nr:OmpH family outer membrane protein [Gallionellaceae bacterium]
MKFWMKIGLPLMLALAAGHAAAADYKIGVVDTERILRDSAPAVNASKKLEKEFAGRKQEVDKLTSQIKDAQAVLDKEGPTMAESTRHAKEHDLDGMTSKLQQMQREFREALNLRKNEELVTVLGLANKAIQQIAESEKYDLILQEAAYRNPRIDITDKVIQYLDNEK